MWKLFFLLFPIKHMMICILYSVFCIFLSFIRIWNKIRWNFKRYTRFENRERSSAEKWQVKITDSISANYFSCALWSLSEAIWNMLPCSVVTLPLIELFSRSSTQFLIFLYFPIPCLLKSSYFHTRHFRPFFVLSFLLFFLSASFPSFFTAPSSRTYFTPLLSLLFFFRFPALFRRIFNCCGMKMTETKYLKLIQNRVSTNEILHKAF